ncbi:LytR/AlgR family response regulator transcription factor [Carnobacterium divergens]|uniref:LytR/AlgR family response regulator transcription factor n=1 Tax=Carnobacterium divergens TaxID=2748 RepID=UPI00054D7C59|nr:LytTR family transcriptional regulator DNA-binding domain-containing protein [Carnobacterium divergens]MDO0876017.1 LytTR family transcriptional regulator DNA-binding domain-containing protein [Carnobacterium divergens]SUX23174.1 Accessory gene regulator protein A [Carnobacterium divergens]
MIDISIYIIEDNHQYSKLIDKIVCDFFETKKNIKLTKYIITDFFNFYRNMEESSFKSTDIYIIDIDLNIKLTGIDIGSKIRKYSISSKIIYLTSLEDKAIEIINEKIRPEGYLIKDIDASAIRLKLINLIEDIVFNMYNAENSIVVNSKTNKNIIAYDEILYIAVLPGERNKLIAYTILGEIIFNGKISDMKKKLPSDFFILNLKSYVINYKKIDSFSYKNESVIFENGSEIYVGKKIIRKIDLHKKGLSI